MSADGRLLVHVTAAGVGPWDAWRFDLSGRAPNSRRSRAFDMIGAGGHMADPPIMCTLTPEALRARREGLLSDLARRAEARETLDNGFRLRFAPLDGILAAVAEAVDAERHCCRFLRFTILVESDGGPVTLELNGPPGTQEFVSALFDA